MFRLFSIVLLLPLLFCSEASSFVIQTGQSSTGQVVQLHWSNNTARNGIPFFIDSRGSDDISDKNALFNVLRASFKVWEAPATTHVRFNDRGLLDAPSINSRDRQNTVSFDETGTLVGAPPGAGVIAVTRVSSDDRTGEILDADLVFNGRDFRFAIGDPGTIRSPVIDLQATTTHEIGHILGIDHTGLIGTAARRPVMNPFDNSGSSGSGRVLKLDDIAAVGYLYPSDAFIGLGRISGTIKRSDGTGAFGVHVVAYDESGNFVVSGLSGYRTGRGGGGEYALVGLPPGSYTVGIEPLNGQVTSANFGGIFSQSFDTNFTAKFYDNAPDRTQASALRVQAGQDVSGISFSTGPITSGFPVIQNPVLPANTPDPAGPYTVQATVSDDKGLSKVTLFYRTGAGSYVALAMRSGLSGSYAADIPGQSRGTTIEYYLEATDTDGHVSAYPAGNASHLFLKVLNPTGRPLAYVALRTSNAVSVLDTGTDPSTSMEVARIPVGQDPIALTITPDEKLICVSNTVGKTVTLIETATNRIVATIPVGNDPVDLIASPDGHFLYVNNTSSSSVSVIDLDRRVETRKISVRASSSASSPPGPYGIAVSPDGKRLYVTAINDNAVVTLDLASGAEIARIPVVTQPRSLALSPDGKRLYVTGLTDGAGVSVINTATNQADTKVSVAATARSFDVAVSPDGRTTYVTDYTNNLIVIDAAAGQVRQVIPVPGQNTRGIAVSSDGSSVYMTNQDSDNMVILDAGTLRVLRTVQLSQGPRDIVFRNQSGINVFAGAFDFDADGVMGISDFFLFATAFGTSAGKTGYNARFDFNLDSQIGFPDFFLFADQFGKKTR